MYLLQNITTLLPELINPMMKVLFHERDIQEHVTVVNQLL